VESHRTPEAFHDWAIETRKRGWTAVKWTLAAQGSGSERTARTCAELEAIRSAVGSAVDLSLEAAETFSVRSAIEFAGAVAKYHPLWIEEPTLSENPAGLGEVAAKSPVAIATGEGLFSLFEYKRCWRLAGLPLFSRMFCTLAVLPRFEKLRRWRKLSARRSHRISAAGRLRTWLH